MDLLVRLVHRRTTALSTFAVMSPHIRLELTSRTERFCTDPVLLRPPNKPAVLHLISYHRIEFSSVSSAFSPLTSIFALVVHLICMYQRSMRVASTPRDTPLQRLSSVHLRIRSPLRVDWQMHRCRKPDNVLHFHHVGAFAPGLFFYPRYYILCWCFHIRSQLTPVDVSLIPHLTNQ